MASLDQAVAFLQNAVQQLGAINSTLMSVFPRITGSFTLVNATTTIVAQPAVLANSIVIPVATNSAAALTARSAGIYLSALNPGVSFSISTQNGSATGTETFSYIVVSPS